MWAKLGDIRGLWSDPWCIGGNFNMVRFPCKNRNCLRMSSAMRCFSKIIEEFQLRDLPLTRRHSTLCGDLNNSSSYRLDRFLVSKE